LGVCGSGPKIEIDPFQPLTPPCPSNIVVEKAKPGRPSTSKRGPWHQYHVKMNVHSLGEVMAMQRWNDRKLVNHACAKAQRNWGELIIVAQQCPPLPKPTLIVVLDFHESKMIHGT